MMSREVVETSSLEMLQSYGDVALRNMDSAPVGVDWGWAG